MFTVHPYVRYPEAAEGLLKNGFCLFQSTVGEDDRLDVLEERRFALSERTKASMTPSNPAGCVKPEEGFASSAEKEAYHFNRASRSTESSHWGLSPFLLQREWIGCNMFDNINENILNHASPLMRGLEEDGSQQHAFPSDVDHKRWMNAIYGSKQHVLSFFRYRASNPHNLHTPAHVDKGVLTICENPNDMEVFVRGEWYPLGPRPAGTIAILVGYSLERATGGIFQAARHRIRNNGNRRSRVTELRFSPNLVLYPPSIIANVSPLLRERVPDPPDVILVKDMMEAFNSIHQSVNVLAQSSLSTASRSKEKLDLAGKMGLFSEIPVDLVFFALSWLRNYLCDTMRLSATCRSLRAIAGSEEHIIPAADASNFPWDNALDRIGGVRPGIATPPVGIENRWLKILGDELLKRKEAIIIRIQDMNREEIQFKVKGSTRIGKVFLAYSQRIGVSVTSFRFLLDGDRVLDDQTPYLLELEDGDVIDATLDQFGD